MDCIEPEITHQVPYAVEIRENDVSPEEEERLWGSAYYVQIGDDAYAGQETVLNDPQLWPAADRYEPQWRIPPSQRQPPPWSDVMMSMTTNHVPEDVNDVVENPADTVQLMSSVTTIGEEEDETEEEHNETGLEEDGQMPVDALDESFQNMSLNGDGSPRV